MEVNRPDRRQRRQLGKSDPLDADAAADAVLAGRARAVPKTADGIVEAIRMLHLTRAGAVKARTAAINELRGLLVTAPAELSERLDGLGGMTLVGACARLRPTSPLSDPLQAAKLALRSLARRSRALGEEITALSTQLHHLVAAARPDLVAIHGVGDETAAQLLITCGDNPDRLTSEAAFAALCATAPIPASSGKTHRHRVSRGGDRQANRAVSIIVLARLATCARTNAYVARRTTQGKSKQEIIRCLKRSVTRELFKALTSPNTQTTSVQATP